MFTRSYFLLCILILPLDAHAYLDPGTGSMLLSVFVGLASSAYFAVRKLPAACRSLFYRIQGKNEILKKNNIVFYCESRAYWNTFAPLLRELSDRKIDVLYLTSNKEDPAFEANLDSSIQVRFIGTGNAAYTALNFLEAECFVLTTPGIDVLQIRRSPGTRKYIHVLHSLSDMHLYKLYSFDYYDQVFCSGEYQQKSLRHLEQTRGTTPKDLPLLGVPYFDELNNRYLRESSQPQEKCVLIAPTWGKNGMLTRLGDKVPKLLAEAGYHVILRPHPQSYVSEKEMIAQLETSLSKYDNIEWDKNPDGFQSMNRAQLLISDFSGIVYDFAFVFLKPVITMNYQPNFDGFDGYNIPWEIWDLSIIDEIGKRLEFEQIEKLPEFVNALQASDEMRSKILSIRERSIANFGQATKPIVDEIIKATQAK